MALPSPQKFRVLPGMLDVGRSDSRGWKKRTFIARSAERERLSEGVKQCEKSSLYRSFDVGFVGDEQMNMGDSDRTRMCGDS